MSTAGLKEKNWDPRTAPLCPAHILGKQDSSFNTRLGCHFMLLLRVT